MQVLKFLYQKQNCTELSWIYKYEAENNIAMDDELATDNAFEDAYTGLHLFILLNILSQSAQSLRDFCHVQILCSAAASILCVQEAILAFCVQEAAVLLHSQFPLLLSLLEQSPDRSHLHDTTLSLLIVRKILECSSI